MGNFKAFFLGIATAYGIYVLTKKRPDGSSLMEDLLNNPNYYAKKAGQYAVEQALEVAKDKLI